MTQMFANKLQCHCGRLRLKYGHHKYVADRSNWSATPQMSAHSNNQNVIAEYANGSVLLIRNRRRRGPFPNHATAAIHTGMPMPRIRGKTPLAIAMPSTHFVQPPRRFRTVPPPIEPHTCFFFWWSGLQSTKRNGCFALG